MAQNGSDTLSCHAPELADSVDEYIEQAGYENRNQALKDIIRVGLRESRSPLLTRWREQIIDWAGHLGLFAMLFVAGGIVTGQATWGIQMAAVMVFFAVAMLASIEVARVFRGQSKLATEIREVIPR